eukprot:COSAG05_NODE_2374_length_3159_cov_2.026471_4_plen_72_part_00
MDGGQDPGGGPPPPQPGARPGIQIFGSGANGAPQFLNIGMLQALLSSGMAGPGMMGGVNSEQLRAFMQQAM